jgi:hypothetical protein
MWDAAGEVGVGLGAAVIAVGIGEKSLETQKKKS